MPKNPIFDAARGRASPDLIERLFNAPGAYWDGDEFWTLNPTRGDSTVGSFSIHGRTGMWSDFAGGGGDLIALMVASGRASSKKDAAEIIVKALDGVLPEAMSTAPAPSHLDRPAKSDKPKAIMPIPEDKLELLKPRINGKWALEHHGVAAKGWVWRDPDGAAWCSTVRFEKTNEQGEVSKDVIAHYWGEDGKWHEGNPMPASRHLFRIDQICKADAGTRILIVEGEKKASVKVPGYLTTTWIGGAKAWQKTDWAPLERFAAAGLVTIWPDADEPGVQAGTGIMKRLPGARLMLIEGKPQGWDLADAVEEGIDPVEFIARAKTVGGPPTPATSATSTGDPSRPFLCLGYDKTAYYFMRRATRNIFSITMGGFNGSKLGELAPIAWWSILGHVTDQGTIKVPTAQEMVSELQHQHGFYDPKRIRGAGVWRDAQGIVLNDGQRIVTMDGKSFGYDEFPTSFYYVPSLVSFGHMAGRESSDEDGAQLEELFKALEFAEESMAILLMGWCLIAPFGGVLTWRPHIWLTGKGGSGKSWIMSNIVQPLCGPFAFLGSGKDTEAGIRWALDQDARPSILAEMEGKNKSSREKIASILELARNASDDGSGSINISQAGGGTKSFRIRSMFAFSSKVMPMEDDSTTARISHLDLQKSKDESRKIARCTELLSNLMDEPELFTRRIFHLLPQIISDIEYLKDRYLHLFRSKRVADQLAPMLCAAWAARSRTSIRTAGPWVEKWIAELAEESKVIVNDEDNFMQSLVAKGIRTDEGKTRTIAELLEAVADQKDNEEAALALLERHGITLRRRYGSQAWRLFIATESGELGALFKDTQWGDAYGAQVRRCPHVIEGVTKPVKLRSGRKRCQALDWDAFRAAYMGPKDEGHMDLELEDEYGKEPPF